LLQPLKAACDDLFVLCKKRDLIFPSFDNLSGFTALESNYLKNVPLWLWGLLSYSGALEDFSPLGGGIHG
jgi:hypothetical protein